MVTENFIFEITLDRMGLLTSGGFQMGCRILSIGGFRGRYNLVCGVLFFMPP